MIETVDAFSPENHERYEASRSLFVCAVVYVLWLFSWVVLCLTPPAGARVRNARTRHAAQRSEPHHDLPAGALTPRVCVSVPRVQGNLIGRAGELLAIRRYTIRPADWRAGARVVARGVDDANYEKARRRER